MTATGPFANFGKETEREMRRLTDHLPVLISFIDASRRYRFVNAAYETWFGHNRAEIEGRHLRDVLGEAAYKRLEPAVDQVLGGERVAFDSRIPYRDGGLRDVHVEYVPRVEQGEIAGFYVMVQDVGERRNAEAALRQSEGRFRAAVEAVHGIIWTNNAKGEMEGDQPGWAALTGQSKDEYQGYGWSKAVHPDDAQPTVEAWNAAVEARKPFAFEHRVRRKDGQWRRFSIRAIPVLDANGAVNEWVGMHADVTEEHAAAARSAALAALSERIREMEDADDLAYAASEILGRTLNLSRVGYGTIHKASETISIERDWSAPGFKSLAGTLHFRDYGTYIDELKRGETVIFADAAKDPRTASTLDALKGINAVSLVNMPVTEQGGLVALLYLNNDTPREWREDELSLIREVADRTRTAVERRRAEVDLRANEARLRFLDELAGETANRHDADAILAVTTRLLGQYLRIDVCAYADMEPDQDAFTIRGDWSAPGAATIVGRYSLADFGALAVEKLRTGEPLVINDNIAELGEEESREFLRIGLRSTICMPFIKEGQLIALMAVHCSKPHRWTPNELALVLEVTARSWAHIERVRSEAALRESEERQAFLLQLSDALRPLETSTDILLTASRMLGKKLNANRIAYSEDQGDGETIVVTQNYVDGVPGIVGRYRYVDFGLNVLAELQTGRTTVRPDIENDPELTDTAKASRKALQIGAQINVPLVKDGRLLAVLGVHYRERHDFTADEITLAEAVAERTWAAVERSRAESVVRQRADELQAVFEAAPAAIWIARDSEGRRIDGNAFARKLLRLNEGRNMSLSAGAEEGPSGFRVLSAEGIELKPEELPVQRAARGEVVRNFEEQIVFEDGSSVYLVGNAQPILGEDGSPRGSVASFVDITARRAAEATVRESEQRFRNMADHAPVMMWVTDPTGYCTYLNRSWYDFTGQTREVAEGFGWLDATHPEDKTEADRIFHEANASQSTFRVEYRLRRADGEYRWCIDAASPRFGAGGEFLGYVGSVIDIEQRRAAELQLRSMNDMLESRISAALEERTKAEEGLRQAQKLEAIGQLTGGVAHDFNNLLMIVQAGLNMMERKDGKAHRDMLIARMREAVTRGANLTRQLLAFSRKEKLAPEAVDFADMMQGMAELLDRSLGAQVQVKLDLAANLASVYVDPNALQLAILNLAVNARDAMPKGGAITIRATNGTPSDARAAYASVSVTDTGEGIPADVRARIFEPFFTTKEIGKGSGLGLAQVHGFALQSGGHVEVQSELGKGTTMTLVLPRSETAALPSLRPRIAFRAARATGDAGHVLLVEDDNEVAALTGEMLEHLGWRVTRAASAEAALGALADDRDIDLVFSDVMMPGGMNGLDLARETRKRRPTLPIVLTSGYAEAVRRDAEQAGVPLLPKPFDLDTLAAVLEVARLN